MVAHWFPYALIATTIIAALWYEDFWKRAAVVFVLIVSILVIRHESYNQGFQDSTCMIAKGLEDKRPDDFHFTFTKDCP